MKNRNYIVFLILVTCIFSSCDFFTKMAQNDNYVTSVSFKNGKYVLYVDEADVCYVEAEPADSFDWYETTFDIEDSTVCKIEGTNDRYCIIRALQVGSTILTAKVGNKEGKCVVTVRQGF